MSFLERYAAIVFALERRQSSQVRRDYAIHQAVNMTSIVVGELPAAILLFTLSLLPLAVFQFFFTYCLIPGALATAIAAYIYAYRVVAPIRRNPARYDLEPSDRDRHWSAFVSWGSTLLLIASSTVTGLVVLGRKEGRLALEEWYLILGWTLVLSALAFVLDKLVMRYAQPAFSARSISTTSGSAGHRGSLALRHLPLFLLACMTQFHRHTNQEWISFASAAWLSLLALWIALLVRDATAREAA